MNYGSKNLVWIASYPKSGNTWFRIVLANLISGFEDTIDINDNKWTLNASSRWLIDEYSGVSSSDLTMSEIDELRPKVYRQLSDESTDLIFLKVHDAWKRNSSGIPLFPVESTKAVVYIIRNPLDIAISFAYHSTAKYDKVIEQMNDTEFSLCAQNDRIVAQLKQGLSDWSNHVASWIDNSGLPVIALRYEDLLQDPFNTFSKAFEFIGVRRSPEEISKAIQNSDFQKLSDIEQKRGFEEKPIRMKKFFRSGKSGEWREQLSPSLVKKLINQHKNMMHRFNYIEEYNAEI